MASVLETPIKTVAAEEPLRSGDVLDQGTFHRRYEQMPRGFRAELIEGVVHVPSPATNWHSVNHAQIMMWLGVYQASTFGVEVADNGTVILDAKNEPQPDAVLRIHEAAGGRSHVNEDGFLAGSPELHVEVSYASQSIDLHQKRRAYERAGIQEYVVVLVEEPAVRFFQLREKAYQEAAVDADGIWRSTVFPGLWLNVQALLDRDGKALLETLQHGLNTVEHRDFVARLQSPASSSA